MTQPLRSAAITTTFFPDSHAGVLVPKFIRGFPADDGLKAAVLMLGDNGYLQKFAYAEKYGFDISALAYHTDGGQAVHHN